MYEVDKLLSRVTMDVLGVHFYYKTLFDSANNSKRIYIQLMYRTSCTKTGGMQVFYSRKWYLSTYMTPDEVIKTAYCALEAAVKHEIMEGFKVDGKVLFNPHVSFEALLSISDQEVTRS